jgi:uncharacterized protein YndB with AHSA1/START domain
VFAAWTEPVHLRKWLASDRWTVSVPVADPRRGAPSLVVMQSRSGEVMTVTLTFEDSGSGTRYTARVRHWPVDEEEDHRNIGLEMQ